MFIVKSIYLYKVKSDTEPVLFLNLIITKCLQGTVLTMYK
jgi:hypothetical protein